MKIYQIDSSARKEGSSSRALAKKLLNKIKKPGDEVIYRDLDDDIMGIPGRFLYLLGPRVCLHSRWQMFACARGRSASLETRRRWKRPKRFWLSVQS